ncbi:YchJ family protein [Actinoplanes xinjiangensis]|uniref:YchJ family protein n=1 Tax=Actinoplanes xinjiangensis TaxID=512350 RepID=UPI003D15F49A
MCPCGRGSYQSCCAPLHDGKPAADPEALMRSRFSAYALDNSDHVLRTWHPETRPAAVDADPAMRWTRLEVLEHSGGGVFDAEGIVEFRAHFTDGGRPGVLAEKSRFVRHDGRWVYWGPL